MHMGNYIKFYIIKLSKESNDGEKWECVECGNWWKFHACGLLIKIGSAVLRAI